jgi:AraC-like DNA-binding protein
MTDRPPHVPQRLPPPADTGRDVLSDVLGAIRLTGAMLFLVDAHAPWKTPAPAAARFAPALRPRPPHLVSFHVVAEGACWAGLADAPLARLHAGDALVVPHGDAYLLASPPDAAADYGEDEAVAFFRAMAAGALSTVVRAGGAGPARTRFLCGFLGCDRRPFNPVLASLPRAIVQRGGGPTDRLRPLVDLALAELDARDAGRREVLLRLAELMFVEVVRRELAQAATDRPHWLGGLRDPLVARALAQLHGAPARRWTLASLAAAVGSSRSVLAGRFAQRVGQPPMQYLTAWRMQRAASLLDAPDARVQTVAEAVGYASEAAFSRAFRRHAGRPPSEWRRGDPCAG